MDVIAKDKETDIGHAVVLTRTVLARTLERNRKEIEAVPRKTFRYGTDPRHQLDVYYPLNSGNLNSVPVFFFVYGGAFITGDRVLPPPNDLTYASLGAFYARRGFLTVIPDYRLVPHVHFPEEAQDVLDAIIWVTQNPDIVGSGDVVPDIDRLFAMGHSAGAANLFTALTYPELAARPPIPLLPKFKGLILSGGAYCNSAVVPSGVQYYGSVEESTQKEPVALLKSAPPDLILALPAILMAEAEKDPEFVKQAGATFKSVLESRLGQSVRKIVAARHNHVSVNEALGGGEGEEWAEEVVQWMWARV